MIGIWRRAAALAALLAGAAHGRPVEDPPTAARPPAPAEAAPAREAEAVPSMRAVEEPGKSMALEVASRRFTPPPGAPGPDVLLVGVVHIGEGGYYDGLEKLLATQDLVLYESVMPPGARGAAGGDPGRRAATTRNTMLYAAALLGDFRRKNGRYPADLAELRAGAGAEDPRIADWIDALADAWGRPLEYAAGAEGGGFALTSRGADGRPGGAGDDEDVAVTAETPLDPARFSWSGTRIQAELAAALGMRFQLDEIDYGPAHFRCSDMDLDQLDAAFRARGAEFSEIAGGLTGTSLFGRLAVFMLRLVRVADIFLEGAIADSMKVTMIEAFSDEKVIDQLMARAGPGLAEVLIDERNQVVVDDLKAAIAGEPGLRSVAIFYGAGHMPDLAERLRAQLGYVPAETTWLRAMEVDLAASAMGAEQLESIRRSVRRQMQLGW
jgi:hypothetical protein